MGISRLDFQWLADARIREANALLDAGLFDGAYYLAGYAVECELKACIAKKIRRFELPDKTFINDVYVHDLKKLLGLAELQLQYSKLKADEQFVGNWDVVKDWNEKARYDTLGSLRLASLRPPFKQGRPSPRAEERARQLYNAITDPKHGVLPWLKKFW